MSYKAHKQSVDPVGGGCVSVFGSVLVIELEIKALLVGERGTGLEM